MIKIIIVMGFSFLASAVFSGPPQIKDILENMYKEYNGYGDYQCRLKEWCTKGNDYENRIINFYFKKPRNIRMDIIKGNKPFEDGSVGVFTDGTNVTGRKGGVLAGFSATLNKKDPLTTTIRGVTFDESDLLSIIHRIEARLNDGVSVVELTNNRYKVAWVSTNSKTKIVSKEIVELSSMTYLPFTADIYEDGKQVQHAEWSDFIFNANLPDSLFKIYYNSDKLSEMGIKSINQVPVK